MDDVPIYALKQSDFTPLIGPIRYAARVTQAPEYDDPNIALQCKLRNVGLLLYHGVIVAAAAGTNTGLEALLQK
jgi:hypothetical protein